jgi:hypothetical protein
VRLRIDLVASIPKDPQQPELNEDKWAFNDPVDRAALSDGASESYDSRTWARLLVDAYVKDQCVSAEWVHQLVSGYSRQIDYSALSWSQQAAFERGSFATLLGLELAPNRLEVEVLAIGDSLAVLVRDNALLESFPYVRPEQFDARPELLCTIAGENAFVSEPGFVTNSSSRTWGIRPGDLVYLVTDAVGHWILGGQGDPDSTPIRLLGAISNPGDFGELVLQLREQRRIRLDDSTVIRLRVEQDEQVGLSGELSVP